MENEKPQKPRMARMQMGIVIALAVIACLLIAIFAGLYLSRNGIAFSPQRNEPTVVLSTPTMIVLPTLTPTQTMTPVPYEQRIPQDWTQFKTDLVELWLPANFETPKNVDKLIEETRKSYEERGLQELINYNDQNESIRDVVATDEISGSALYRTIVTVSYRPLEEQSLDIQIQRELAKLPSMIVLVERKNVQIGSSEAVRLLYEMRMGNLYANHLEYIFLDGITVWSVTYYAEINEFFQQLPTFEQSVQTFRTVQ